MTKKHAAYLRHLEAYEPDLEGWKLRAQRLEKPEPTSDLYEDNKVFLHPISDEARLSLISAGEHLRLAWTAIKADELYPSAHFTTLRSALVAASQAVYILGPDASATRRGRGLTVIVESYKKLRQYHKECLNTPDLPDSDKDMVQQQLSWLDGRIDGARKAGAQNAALNLSDQVIPYAGSFVYGKKPELQHKVMLLWRQMSGDAHALAWALTLRAQLEAPKNGQLLTAGTVGGSLEDIAEPFEASFRILKRGWSLFDQRCEEKNTHIRPERR